MWFEVRRYRITASIFGEIMRRRSETPPDSLVLRIIQQQRFSSQALEWGIKNEPYAIEAYKKYRHAAGCTDLIVSASGFIISLSHPFLGATPDGAIYDPSSPDKPYGFLEVKCPYTVRDKTPEEACSVPGFCCSIDHTSSKKVMKLRENHPYYCQVQGQMAIGQRPWCDFVVFTNKGISVERIRYNHHFWENELLPKLINFYDNCIAPEIVSPMHSLGLPMRDLRKK